MLNDGQGAAEIVAELVESGIALSRLRGAISEP
jgi:hypothetical protein